MAEREVNTLSFMAPALAACLVLAGMHCYLGLHIVARGVFFVDLALAQMAALGAAVGLLAGVETERPLSYAFSIGATFVGSLLFVASRRLERRVSPEAVIGIVYAVAAGAAILVMDKSPEGAEHLKELMVGTLLLTPWMTIGVVALLYGALGIAHFLLRGPLLRESFDPSAARRAGQSRGLWDFVLYATFGIVVTISVRLAGVLVVFVLLVIPAVVASAAAVTVRARLLLGWLIGMAVTSLGVLLSFLADVSTGACIVVTFGGFALLSATVAALRGRTSAAPL